MVESCRQQPLKVPLRIVVNQDVKYAQTCCTRSKISHKNWTNDCFYSIDFLKNKLGVFEIGFCKFD